MKQLSLQFSSDPSQDSHTKSERRSNPLIVASWNVNSIRARLNNVVRWLHVNQPDILCLQETKVAEEAFPNAVFESEGYHVTSFGQKQYNGVAIISRESPTFVERGFGEEAPVEARCLFARFPSLNVCNVYVPNARSVDDESFTRKLIWLRRLRLFASERITHDREFLLCGDFNVAPEDIDVDSLKNPLYATFIDRDLRKEFRGLVDLGLIDAFRHTNQQMRAFTWWDYRSNAFSEDRGMRLDHFLVNAITQKRLLSVRVDQDERGRDKASDHAPVVLELVQEFK